MPGLLTVLACGIGVILLRLPRPTLPTMTSHRPQHPKQPAKSMTGTQALAELHALVSSDAYAMTFQSSSSYRAAIKQSIEQYQKQIESKPSCPA